MSHATENTEINLHPTQNYLLIKPTEVPEKQGSIIIPEASRNARPITTGTIVEIGPDCKSAQFGDPEWFPGQFVLFPQHCEYKVAFGHNVMFFVRETDIIAASEPEPTKATYQESFQSGKKMKMCPVCAETTSSDTCENPECRLYLK